MHTYPGLTFMCFVLDGESSERVIRDDKTWLGTKQTQNFDYNWSPNSTVEQLASKPLYYIRYFKSFRNDLKLYVTATSFHAKYTLQK